MSQILLLNVWSSNREIVAKKIIMGTYLSYQTTNEQYLTTTLTSLRQRLQHLITPSDPIDLSHPPEPTDPPPPLILLSRRFGLSRFEQETLLLCVAMELDSKIADG